MGSIRSRAPLLLALACFVATIIASPIPEENAAEPVRETLDTLDLETPSHDDSQRDKRTIGFLRTLFPGLSEIIDRKIQSLTRIIFRLVGRLVLGGGGGGTGSSSSSSSSASSSGGSRRISITLPTFPPSLDDEEEESQTEQESTSEPNFEDNLAGSESRVNEVRVPYDGDAAELEEEDQEAEATGDEASPAVARSEDTAEDSDNAAAASENTDREKRFLFFGGGDSSSSSGGGSGNFLFDIIRNAADTSARTVGRLYRVIAGTDLSASSNSTIVVRSGAQKSTTLISGSGASDTTSDSGSSSGGDGASADVSASLDAAGDGGAAAGAGAKAAAPAVDPNDGYTSGIPGPLTRLFIIANRGISNLLQDLILRLSQTSERIVNFKARLITALI